MVVLGRGDVVVVASLVVVGSVVGVVILGLANTVVVASLVVVGSTVVVVVLGAADVVVGVSSVVVGSDLVNTFGVIVECSLSLSYLLSIELGVYKYIFFGDRIL